MLGHKDKVMFELLNRKEIKCVLEGSREAREIIDKAHYLITSSLILPIIKELDRFILLLGMVFL